MSKSGEPDRALLAWLNSDEGMLWLRGACKPVLHCKGAFADVKDGHECEASKTFNGNCSDRWMYIPFPDETINADIYRYGMSGVPWEWKDAWRRSQE